VTRKITRGLASILAGRQKKLFLGNLEARRDWGFAPEYVQMMWLMLQQKRADDYVVGTGETHSVKEFVEKVFAYGGINIFWRGKGVKTRGVVGSLDLRLKGSSFPKKGDVIIEIDKRYFRPTEVDCLCADIAKAKKQLRWQPKVKFDSLVKIMTDYDLSAAGVEPPGDGIKICKQKEFNYLSDDHCAK